ncbi:hypothetical protein DV738_g1668, partial [Chaetothyriales sp. CBS 135597]
MSKDRLRAQCLPENADCSYVKVTIGDQLAGNVFACRWKVKDKTVCWITQLVVHSDYRERGLAAGLLNCLRQEDDKIYGLMSSHPAACLAAAKTFGSGINSVSTSFISDNASSVMKESPIEYVRKAELRGNLFDSDDKTGAISSVFSNFFVDHAEPLEALNWVRQGLEWPLDVFRSFQDQPHPLSWPFPSWKDFREASVFTQLNYTNLVLLVLLFAYAIYQAWSKNASHTWSVLQFTPALLTIGQAEAEEAGRKSRYLPAPDFPPIEGLADFDYKTTEPVKLRPFKPKYNLTMAIENLDPNELLLMDKTYPSRIAYRRTILQNHQEDVCAIANEAVIAPAIRELYTFLLGTYLPIRFPRMFKLHQVDYETGKTYMLENLVTKEVYPAFPIPPTTKALVLLQTLGKTVDEDFFFLLPSDPAASSPLPLPSPSSASSEDPTSGGEPDKEASPSKYHLHAFVCCCPSGFSPRSKLGLPLASVHEPVPGYSSIIEGSMDRYFAKIQVGKYVKRVNWSIATHGELYASPAATAEGSNISTHAYAGDQITELAEVDPSQTFVRVERQTLHRLPNSKAIVFAFKTYLYPLDQFKADNGPEGAEQLAQAVDGLKVGNVPAMHFYKRGAVWAEAVKRYLRS